MQAIEYEMTDRDGVAVREIVDLPPQAEAEVRRLMLMHGARRAWPVNFIVDGASAKMLGGEPPAGGPSRGARLGGWARRHGFELACLLLFLAALAWSGRR